MRKPLWTVAIGSRVYREHLTLKKATKIAEKLQCCVIGVALESEMGR